MEVEVDRASRRLDVGWRMESKVAGSLVGGLSCGRHTGYHGAQYGAMGKVTHSCTIRDEIHISMSLLCDLII